MRGRTGRGKPPLPPDKVSVSHVFELGISLFVAGLVFVCTGLGGFCVFCRLHRRPCGLMLPLWFFPNLNNQMKL